MVNLRLEIRALDSIVIEKQVLEKCTKNKTITSLVSTKSGETNNWNLRTRL